MKRKVINTKQGMEIWVHEIKIIEEEKWTQSTTFDIVRTWHPHILAPAARFPGERNRMSSEILSSLYSMWIEDLWGRGGTMQVPNTMHEDKKLTTKV